MTVDWAQMEAWVANNVATCEVCGSMATHYVRCMETNTHAIMCPKCTVVEVAAHEHQTVMGAL